jgi:hypothetical protein
MRFEGQTSKRKEPGEGDIIVLIRNTTFRCGKLERPIMEHLYRKYRTLGTREIPVSDIFQSLELLGRKKNELRCGEAAGKKEYNKNSQVRELISSLRLFQDFAMISFAFSTHR